MKKEENVKRVVKILCFVICFVLSKLTNHGYFILNGFLNENITKWILLVGKY